MPKDRIVTDAQALFARGDENAQKSDFREAVECYTRAIALRPDVAAGYRARAKAYVELGRRTDALNDLDLAVRLKPDDPALYAERAEILYRQHAYDQAIADCDKVLSLDPGWGAAVGLRGECHAAMGSTPAALADFAAAIEADPPHASKYLLARASLYLECEQPSAAAEDAGMALRLDPTDAGGHRLLGIARRELGDLDGADASLTEAIRLDPDGPLAVLARATLRYEQKRFTEAIVDADRAVQLAPGSAKPHTLRGVCRQNLGDLPGAIEDFTIASQSSPSSPHTFNLRAGIYYRMNDFARAVQDHLEALKRDPRSSASFNQIGWVRATAPDPDVRNGKQARECATRACELSEWQEAGFVDTLAAACAECGEFDDAVRWQTKALSLAPEIAKADFQTRLDLYQAGKPYRTKPI